MIRSIYSQLEMIRLCRIWIPTPFTHNNYHGLNFTRSRFISTKNSKTSSKKFLLKAILFGGTIMGGVVGYSMYIDDLRKYITMNMPGTDDLLMNDNLAETQTKIDYILPTPSISSSRVQDSENLTNLTLEGLEDLSTESTGIDVDSHIKEFKEEIANVKKLTDIALRCVETAVSTIHERMEVARMASYGGDVDANLVNKKRESMFHMNEKINVMYTAMNKAENAVSLIIKSIESSFIKMNEYLEATDIGILNRIKNEANDCLDVLNEQRTKFEQLKKDELKLMKNCRDSNRHQMFISDLSKLMPHIKFDSEDVVFSQDDFGRFVDIVIDKMLQIDGKIKEKHLDELKQLKYSLEDEFKKEQNERIENSKTETSSIVRQIVASYSDYISDLNRLHTGDLKRAQQMKVDDALMAKINFDEGLSASALGAIEGVKTALDQRSQLNKDVLQAQRVWLAVSQLCDAVFRGGHLSDYVEQIRSNCEDEFVKTLLVSIPVDKYVSSENDLNCRFIPVAKLARSFSLVREEGGSLLRYALSFLLSKLVCHTQPSSALIDVALEEQTALLDVSYPLNNFDVIWLIQQSLDRGNLEQAVRYASLLNGQSKRVTADWVAQARQLLETKLACRALLSHASMIVMESVNVN